MKFKSSKITVSFMLIAALAMLMVFCLINLAVATPTIKTDWPSYVPGELVTISGSGFSDSEIVTVTIAWPDGIRIDSLDPAPATDSAGNFTCIYILPIDAKHGTYTVTATDQSGVSASTTFSGTEDFYGYNRDSITDPLPGNWTKGNLGGNYVEGDFVSYQLYLDNASKAWGYNFTISFNFHQDTSNAVYIDGFDTSASTGFQYTGTNSLLPDGTPIPPGGWGTHIPTPAAGEPDPGSGQPQITGFMDPYPPATIEPGNPTGATVADIRAFNVTNLPWDDFTDGYVILFFRAHLSLDIIWSNGQEADLPTQLDGDAFQNWTNAFHGSSFATGSSRHFFLEFPGIGNKEIPIPITEYPSTLINGYKYVDDVLFDGWNITLMGNLTLGSGLPPIPYNPPMVQTGIGTFTNGSAWPTGYFEFTGLVTGDYNVTEENRAGYTHLNIVTSGNGTGVSTNVAEGWAVFHLPGGGTETISFYNTYAQPDIALTKTPNLTKVENGSLVTYTYNVTNTGNVPLTVNLTDDQFGTLFTGKVMAAGESNITTISRTLVANTTNIANATGYYPPTSAYVNANATAFVHVIHPDIALTKTPDATKVENNTSVTYTFNVTNTGDTPLTVSLSDSELGSIFTGLVLAPGASNITMRSAALIANTTNIATAIGVDQLATSVNANATAFVHVIHPDIALTKTPDATKVLNGTSVTYTYNVTNTGDTLLTVNLTDSVYGTLFTGKLLAPGESNITTVSSILTLNTTNIATATGVDQLGATTTANATAFVVVIHPAISVTKTCSPEEQLAPGTITWNITVTNTGDVPLTAVNVTDTRHGYLGSQGTLNPGQSMYFTIVEVDLPPATYYDNATAFGAHQLGTVSDWDDAECVVRPVYILKQFTGVTVLPGGLTAGFNATLVNSTQVDVFGLHSGPYIYFNITYYFENSANFLGDSFDGQAHNFTLWDKWGGNLMALGSPPVAFDPLKNEVTLADNSTFEIDPRKSNANSYRGYIGDGLDISDLASQGEAWITMHLGDQQNGTNPGKGKGTSKDSKSYDTDTVWYIGELGVNESATLNLIIAPGKNPGGQLLFSSNGCTVINTGPRVRVYGDSYENEDFLYAVERTNTLKVCVKPIV